jgi:methionyl-tRNA formyltransferase
MRLILFGSGEFGVPTFEHLRTRHETVALVSQPDRPAGRHRRLTPTPAAQWAATCGMPVFKSDDVNTPGFIDQVREINPEVGVVIAFGQKLSSGLIGAMGSLAVNLHASLLPRHRGAAPINWAMIAGDYEVGVSVIGLAQRMDAGAVYATARTTVQRTETAGELHDRLAAMGGSVVAGVLDDLAKGTLTPIKQDDTLVTRAPKLSKADGWVDFDDDCYKVRCRVHGLTPWPGVRVIWHRKSDDSSHELLLRRVNDEPDLSCFISNQRKREPIPGTVLEGLRVACRDGAVKLIELQLPGGKVMDADAFARGHGLRPGDTFARAT